MIQLLPLRSGLGWLFRKRILLTFLHLYVPKIIFQTITINLHTFSGQLAESPTAALD